MAGEAEVEEVLLLKGYKVDCVMPTGFLGQPPLPNLYHFERKSLGDGAEDFLFILDHPGLTLTLLQSP